MHAHVWALDDHDSVSPRRERRCTPSWPRDVRAWSRKP